MDNVEFFAMCEILSWCSVSFTVWHTGRMALCIAHAEPACISQRKREKGSGSIWYTINSTQRDKERSTSWRASWEHWATTEFITQLTLRLKRQIKGDMTLYWNDFRIVQFAESHSSRSDATKQSAHTTTKFQKKIHTYVCSAEEHKRCQNSWVLILNSQGTNGPMKQREDYADAIRIKERLYEEFGEGRTKLHPSNQVRQRANQPFLRFSEGAERVDPKLDGDGILYHLIKFIFVMWQSSKKWWQASSWMNSEIFDFCFAHRQWRFPLQPTGCKTYTTPAHIPHFRNTWIFSRGSRLESSSQQGVFVSWQNSLVHICHAMSHGQSLLCPYLTASAHSTRTPTATSYCSLHMEMTTATIHDPERRLAIRLNRTPL